MRQESPIDSCANSVAAMPRTSRNPSEDADRGMIEYCNWRQHTRELQDRGNHAAAARAAGAAPLRVGEPGYRSGLDRDSDGVACE
jgi:hypothetical protein